MKRFITVNDKEIDTLTEIKNGYYYYEIEGIIYYLWDETMLEYEVGVKQKEHD